MRVIEIRRPASETCPCTDPPRVWEATIVTLRFIAKDPESRVNGSPTLFDNGETYVVQGWKVTDAAVLAALGDLPERETVIEIPKRLVRFFPEVNGDGGGDAQTAER